MNPRRFRDISTGYGSVLTAARPKGPFTHSARRGTTKLHLTDEACALWYRGRLTHFAAAAKCGQVLANVRFAMHAPDGLELCDCCVLSDGRRPSVYRFDDAHGQPLYIGRTENLCARLVGHASSSESAKWFPFVAGATFTEYADLPAALAAEEADIRRHLPAFNKHYTQSAP